MATTKPITISASTIEDRLQSHSRAFTSLLELIPAKYYYGNEDSTRQWNKRKQTKAQNVIAKKAKLDPDALGVGLGPEPADKQEFKNGSERRRRERKRSSTINALAIATAKGGGDESDDNKGTGEEAQEIALDGFTFTTELNASSSPPTTSTSDKKRGITATATGAECATTRKADQCARLAAKIQGLKEKREGRPSPAISTNKSSKRKNAEAKKRKKERKRQTTG
ncbi:60S ribosome biogenesis protein Rrp14-domain-containing protein [Tuber borchii]|uniref:60S ribosome biogenesis protein Rrp14-domain-containing protein n=1 Tax=Tuber borchii TaxID=42251 RepID=A0A2T7A1E5_TUBBO|nr:60S ribosome biogenesis protein Rrp14-domain-containing protein [Tuber borchii]